MDMDAQGGSEDYLKFKRLNEELVIKDEPIRHNEYTVEFEVPMIDELTDDTQLKSAVPSENVTMERSHLDSLEAEQKDKLFKCDICDEVYSSSSNLKSHILIHSKEAPYKCDTCHKTFKLSSTLGRHIRNSHKGVIAAQDLKIGQELINARAERALTKRRLNALPAEVRKEVICHKRQVELQRVLLPDAPPRKKQTRRPSPEREACPLVEELSAAENEPAPEPELEVILDYDNMDVIILGDEVEVETQPRTSHRTSTNTTDNENLVDSWLQDDDSDVDLDFDFDVSDSCFPVMRNAATELSCGTDMTELETRVLQTEDELNDRLLRDIVPNNDYYSFDWKKDKANFTGRRETFTGLSGPTFDITNKTPVDIFYKMFDTNFINRLCTETNRYAEQKIARLKAENKLLPTSRLHRWTPTDCDEMITFLAMLILQGLYPLPEEEKYFSFNGFGTMPYFSRIMSFNRFSLLKSLYHFVDNETLTDKTKLCKIKPVCDYLNEKFSTLYMPAQEIAIDESLLKWHGRLSFAQKIATKAAQVGVKTYELCESRTGYLWKFFVYVGKNTQADLSTEDETIDLPHDETVDEPDDEIVDRPDDETIDQSHDILHDRSEIETLLQDETIDRSDDNVLRPTNATAKIVFDLIEPLLDRGHTLIMDNFYNSPLLLRCLKKHKTDCYGTLRLNREFVPDTLKTLTKTDLRHGEVVASYCSDLSVMVWRDANLVSMISTYHHLQVGVQNKYNRLTYKPKIVIDYNKSMGGVDRKDQFLSAQPLERLRNKVWYKKVFCRLLNTAVFNAYVIFSSQNPKISHRQFRTILSEDLLKIHRRIDLTTEPRLYANRAQGQSPVRTNDRPNVDHDHYPTRSTIKKPRCWMCTRRKRDTRTIWKCIQCDISLCIEHCFREYHKQVL